jgi:hypothetical protein
MRVGKRQGAQEQSVDDAEDGGVGSDGQSKNQYGDGSKAGVAAERAESVTHVLEQIRPVIRKALAAFRFLSHLPAYPPDGAEVSELALGFFAGSFRMPTLIDEVVRFGVQVEA